MDIVGRAIDLSIALIIVSAFILFYGCAEQAARRLLNREKDNRRMRRQIGWYHGCDIREHVRTVDQPLRLVEDAA